MSLDAVEVKVNVATSDIQQAITELELADESSMRLWFFEDETPGIEPLTLLHAGVVLRVRVRANGKTESTVKLRPCRMSQLTADWRDEFADGNLTYTIEEDRSRTSRVVAASCSVDHGKPQSLDGPPYAVADLLTDPQLQFLRTCSAIRVNPREVVPLGPIEATRWKSVGGASIADLEPRAEMWTVRGTRYFEISVRATPESAGSAASRLAQLLRNQHLSEDISQDSKTSRVLMALSGLASAGVPQGSPAERIADVSARSSV